MPPRLRAAQRLVNSHHLQSSSQSSSIYSLTQSPCTSPCRNFSSTPNLEISKRRQAMFGWLNGPGRVFKEPAPSGPNYLTAYERDGNPVRPRTRVSSSGELEELATPLQPFPLNRVFVSESVLSEELRNEIYTQVVEKGKSVRLVSVMFGVDMRRIGAVVRLVELEKRMKAEKKPLALPYGRAVRSMLPTTPLSDRGQPQPAHEPINDLPVHKLTEPQMFYPVSESRHFNRIDAARVFSAAPAVPASERDQPGNAEEYIAKVTHNPHKIEKVGKGAKEHQVLQPAEVRIPHPHMVVAEGDRSALSNEKGERNRRFMQRIEADERVEKERKEKRKAREAASMTRVEPQAGRFEFRFRDVVVSRETVGVDGRGEKGVGRRYGVPHADRRRGEVKIPTRVEV
ncbi:hypothetical protein MGYG_04429 [Nannizzia gypsea CBS 118893]|uniref:37S ribosomal protein S35 n=1 Tax=Arthroderma gypseum (strain ATCC MYA-4604 / CBS 118893) TaxID=535722 RepID=E4USX4_ARTGP|nr:hypothetical protein MGYG_04429 [Nannizzia gypsea CBS 118893]EFR01423.1 hypothetical protein MGYG_04429 [Nannizzia gypsea CBS 118893]